MLRFISALWLSGAVLLSLAGLAAFVYLFLREINLFYLILSPVILAVYQFPAVLVFRLWKGWKRRHFPSEEKEEKEGKEEKTEEDARQSREE